MADLNGSPTIGGGAGAAPQTRSQIMSAIRSAPQTVPGAAPKVTQPTITAPSAAPAEKPAATEAVRLEVGGGGGTIEGADPLRVEGAEGVEGGDPSGEASPSESEEPIDYAAKYQEIMDSGDLHPSLLDKMGIAKINGVDTPVTVKEAFKGYMRRSDHSKAMNELQQREVQFNSEKDRIAGMWGAFKDKPELAVEVFSERFGDGWLDQMVQVRQRAVEEYDNAILDAGHRAVIQLGIDPRLASQDPRVIAAMSQAKERLDRQRSLEAENRTLKRKAEEFEQAQAQQAQVQETQSYGDRFQATIKRFSDAALKAEGLPVNEIAKADLQQCVAQLLIAKNQGVGEKQRDYTITQDLVREAAGILKEQREDGRRSAAPQEAPLPPRQGMGVGSGGVAKPNGAPQTRSQIMGTIRGQR